jgi:hypothetical protein
VTEHEQSGPAPLGAHPLEGLVGPPAYLVGHLVAAVGVERAQVQWSAPMACRNLSLSSRPWTARGPAGAPARSAQFSRTSAIVASTMSRASRASEDSAVSEARGRALDELARRLSLRRGDTRVSTAGHLLPPTFLASCYRDPLKPNKSPSNSSTTPSQEALLQERRSIVHWYGYPTSCDTDPR